MPSPVSVNALLLDCSRPHPSPLVLERIRSMAGTVDWTAFAAAANTHLVTPLVFSNLMKARATIPGALLTEWQELPAMAARDNLARLSELDRLFHLFETEGIPAVTWKGPALAATGYGSLSVRTCCDLDVLVPFERIADVRGLLVARGYTLNQHALEWLAPRAWHEFVFLPPEPGHGAIEVHPLIALWCFVAQPSATDLIARSTSITVAGRTIRTLSNEDMLLAVVLHGALHWWMRLRLIGDVDACVHVDMDWQTVVARARQIGMHRLLMMALLVAHELLESPVPPHIVKEAEQDRIAVWLKMYVARRLGHPTGLLTYPGDLLALLSHDRMIDRLRHTMRLFVWREIVFRAERFAGWRRSRSW